MQGVSIMEEEGEGSAYGQATKGAAKRKASAP